MSSIDENPRPQGELALRVSCTLAATNGFGDVYGGWIVSQMDQAATSTATSVAGGRVVAVSIKQTDFIVAVEVGAIVSCYCDISHIGRSSIEVAVEVWINYPETGQMLKVTEGSCIYVAVDSNGLTQRIAD